MFMLVILKIPVVYLCIVVWWAIRAEPQPQEGAARVAPVLPRLPGCDWRRRRVLVRPRGGPHPRSGPHVGAGRRVAEARGRVRA
jgi:hypothetical protein